MKALVIVLAAFIAAAIAVKRGQLPQDPGRHPERQRSDLEGIAPHVERAAALLEQLRELDDLRTSLELCAPRERAAALRLEWVNHNGSKHAADLWMDGHSSTAAMLEAATQERELLCTSLLEEIRAAYSGECVTETGGSCFCGSCGSPSHAVTVTDTETERGRLLDA